MEGVLKARFGETGETPFVLESLSAPEFPGLFIPPARLKEIRRELYRLLEQNATARVRKALEESRRSAHAEIDCLEISGSCRDRREELLISVSSPSDVRWALSRGATEVLLPLSRSAIHSAGSHTARLAGQASKIRWQLPFMLFDKDIPFFIEGIKGLYSGGFRNFEINNPGHFKIMEGFAGCSFTSGYRLFSLNSQAVRAWQELGIERGTCYLEDDRDNLKELLASSLRLSMIVYSPVDVMTTRIKMKDVATGAPLRSDRGEEYDVRGRDGLFLVSSTEPFSLTGRLSELRGAGCRSFTLDLSDTNPQHRDFIVESFRSDREIQGTTMFNYDRGLL